jgi:hypothetical protein
LDLQRLPVKAATLPAKASRQKWFGVSRAPGIQERLSRREKKPKKSAKEIDKAVPNPKHQLEWPDKEQPNHKSAEHSFDWRNQYAENKRRHVVDATIHYDDIAMEERAMNTRQPDQRRQHEQRIARYSEQNVPPLVRIRRRQTLH